MWARKALVQYQVLLIINITESAGFKTHGATSGQDEKVKLYYEMWARKALVQYQILLIY